MKRQAAESDAPRFIAFKAVAKLLGVCERTIRREVERGKFPRPVPLSLGRTLFDRLEVEEWIAKQMSKRER